MTELEARVKQLEERVKKLEKLLDPDFDAPGDLSHFDIKDENPE